MDKATQLGEMKVSTLLIKFSVPAIIGMIVNAVYNLVDRIYIGNGVGSLGIAATTVGFPVMLITMATSMLIGFGGNAILSIRLGQQRREDAEVILGNSLVLLIIVALGVSLPAVLVIDPLLRFFGASADVLPYAKDYMTVILLGNIFMTLSFGMNNFIRAEGNPSVAMKTMLIGAVLNIILDPIFIFVLNWGMSGAAFATILSQMASMIWVLHYFLGSKSLLKIRKKNLKLHPGTVKIILTLGFPPFAMQLASSLQNMIMNRSLVEYGGDLAMGAVGVTMSIITLILMPIFGINQGVQPIIGYNYGAEKYDRVKEGIKLGILAAVGIATFGFLITRLFPEQLVSIFNPNDAALIEMGKRAMAISMSFLPLVGFQVVGSHYFQAVGKPKHAAFLSLSRQFFILIPALLIIPRFFGLNGVYASLPFSDVLSSIITAVFLYREMKHLKESHTRTMEKLEKAT